MGGTDKAATPRQEALGKRLRQKREALGASQDDVAYAADVNRAYLAGLEGGYRNPTLEVLSRLAVALRCDLADLVHGLQKRKGHSTEAQPVRVRHRRRL